MITQKDILVFGDSIIYGAWDPVDGGWVSRLRKMIEMRIKDDEDVHRVYNLGVSGSTSTEVQHHISTEIENLVKADHELIVIIGVGANDSALINDRDPRVPVEEFSANISTVIDNLKKYRAITIFLSILPIDESAVSPAPWHQEIYYRQNNIDKYNQVLRKTSENKTTYYLDIGHGFVGDDRVLEDGLHPNSRGHEMIANTIHDFLVKQKLV